MLPINIAPLIFTLTTAFGVLVHDTQIDKAATYAIALPAAFVSFAAIDTISKSSEHVHVERVSAPSNFAGVPRIQPRDDERRYFSARKDFSTGGDNGYLWPSV